MRRISVLTKPAYCVEIQRGLLNHLKEAALPYKNRTVFLLTDWHVWPIYGAFVEEAFGDALVQTYVCPAGETAKSVASFGGVMEAMAEAGLHRDALLLTLGGGVVGDLGGFCAASFLRGIDFLQIPTSLLAAVDASVGGKTAINLHAGKNLCGAFHQPVAVWIDPDVFATLPEEKRLDGVAEMLKTGAIFDVALFNRMAEGLRPNDADLEELLSRCIQYKADVVAKDEKDRGERQLLNFGHTFGHAVEARSGFSLSHGHAVAIGMAMMARACAEKGICPAETKDRIERALQQNGLPIRTEYAAQELLPFVTRDKKIKNESVQLVVMEEPGKARLQPTPLTEVESWLEAGQ
ncbi:MAG: 3-dehydroquinate synthase [Tissierellia bacterium]|nr:3-dehydroquinate synthase [Bacillota bacterium]NLK57777.1 3-dehydroquinate synthase [Tissierellia bacterium]